MRPFEVAVGVEPEFLEPGQLRLLHRTPEQLAEIGDSGRQLAVGELIIEGTREGLQAARARGRTGGRKPKLSARQAATARRMYEAVGPDGRLQHAVAEIAEAVGAHRTTVYG